MGIITLRQHKQGNKHREHTNHAISTLEDRASAKQRNSTRRVRLNFMLIEARHPGIKRFREQSEAFIEIRGAVAHQIAYMIAIWVHQAEDIVVYW